MADYLSIILGFLVAITVASLYFYSIYIATHQEYSKLNTGIISTNLVLGILISLVIWSIGNIKPDPNDDIITGFKLFCNWKVSVLYVLPCIMSSFAYFYGKKMMQ